MNILIAGGSGLIGSAIMHHLWEYAPVSYDIKSPPYSGWSWFSASLPLSNFTTRTDFNFDTFIDCSWPAKPSDQFKTWNTVVEHFKQQGHGKMILFSSIYGHKAPDFGMYEGTEIQAKPIEYAMLKAATEQATRYLAQKLKPWGIQVNCIAPGGVHNKESMLFETRYCASGFAPMIRTKNILPVVDMLLHPDNAVNGEIITVDGGWTL